MKFNTTDLRDCDCISMKTICLSLCAINLKVYEEKNILLSLRF
jgi:hypothetical protein